MDDSTSEPTETARLLGLARAGDRRAFDELFGRHRAHLLKFVDLRMDAKLRRRIDASDVVQETLLAAYRRLDDYLARRPMPFPVWLRKTAYERLLNLRQKHVGAARRAVGREAPTPDRSSGGSASRPSCGPSHSSPRPIARYS